MNKKIDFSDQEHKRLLGITSSFMTFDDVLSNLADVTYEIDRYVHEYIEKAEGKCIFENVLGFLVIANHHFSREGPCKKCGLDLTAEEAQCTSPVIELKL